MFGEEDRFSRAVDADEAAGGGVVGDALAGEGGLLAVDEFEDFAVLRYP